MHDTEIEKENVILVAIEDEESLLKSEDSLNELSLLAKTAGALEVGRLIQNRENAHRKHYLGKGKVYELKDLISLTNATGIICDDELSNTQQRELSEMLETKVMDRTMLILDIFASRAKTKEGSLQVELAQLKYNLSHLAGSRENLSRLGGGGGGIGARRGSGEKKLEIDRRRIREKIWELDKELSEIEVQRSVMREKRKKSGIPVISMVGYTNAGKSTLMNTLSNAGVLAEDKLFATLDTTTRKVSLSSGENILFADTVGFIQKLPHNLIKAFRATLEELLYADILIHVVDSSSEVREEQMKIVYETLKQITNGDIDKPVITVFNKMDKDITLPLPTDTYAKKQVKICAKEGTGINELITSIEEVLKEIRNFVKILVPYKDGHIINILHGNCEILKEEHIEEGTYLELYVDSNLEGKIKQYKVDSND